MIMNEVKVSNPKDYQVVSFRNSTDFGFTPEMGCMYDGRAITGRNGLPGIEAGETIILPYHIGHQLAKNLAKRVFNTSIPATVDPAGIPTGVPIWNEAKLNDLKNTFLTDLYSESKPVAQSETDKLMAKIEEFRKLETKIDEKLGQLKGVTETKEETTEKVATTETPKVYLDKKEVIDELTKRSIKFDARKSKAELEKLLA